MTVLHNLKVWQKLALVCALFCVPIAVLLFLLVSEKNIAIQFAAKELKGTEYLRPLRLLFELAPDYARLSLAAARGDASVGPARQRARALVEEALTALTAVENRLGPDLGTAEKAGALRRSWQAANGDASATETQERHAVVVKDLRALLAQAGDGSNLILDPDLDSFYVMDAVLLKIPDIVDLLARRRALEEGSSARGERTADEKTQAVVLAGLLRSAAAGLEGDFEVAFRENPAGNLKPALAEPLSQALDSLGRALNRADGGAAQGGPTNPPRQLAEELGAARTAVLTLWDATTPRLDELLLNRIAGFQRRKAASLAVVGVCLLLCATLVWTIVRSINGPLAQGVELASAIAAGRVETRLQRRALTRRDEVGQLMNALDRMSASVGGFLRQVDLSSSTLAAASDQLSLSAAAIGKGAGEQSERSDQVSTAATEMSATIQDVARHALGVAQTAGEAAGMASRGGDLVERTVTGMLGIASTVQATAEAVDALGRRSEEIGRIVGVIGDIADQTNLLSLNAAIEAARAGHHGRGFAVVADEIHKLADRTTAATRDIGDLIASLRTGIAVAVGAMGTSVREVERGVSLGGEASQALGDILSRIHSVRGMVDQIAAASEEQAVTSAQISGDIESVAAVAQRSASESQQIVASSTELTGLASSLKALVSSFCGGRAPSDSPA